jgi:single-strand DNA-binding protein
MSSINRVILVGRLTRDPELRHTPGGTPVCNFSLAVNSREKDDSGEWGERADFFDITVWGNQGENCAQYLAKGRLAAVDGNLRQERWEKDGQKRSKVTITARQVQFLDSGDRDGDTGGGYDGSQEFVPAGSGQAAVDDDIPF